MSEPEYDLDALGREHRRAMKRLAEVREQLAPAIRQEKDKGATHAELLHRSGYTGMETIRQILDPKRREEMNKRRQRPTPEES